ncbi:MAG: hypothetical protein ACR2MG_15875 [Pyrinomonadaceae bacterium]
MKKTLLLLATVILLNAGGFAQSDIKMQNKYGSENIDLLSVLRFEEIGMSKLVFSGEDLKGKDFQISVKQYVKGKLTKTDIVFDSKEDEYFRIKSDKFVFRVLTKITQQDTAKFDFQFDGFRKGREYKVGKNNRGFAQKDFLGSSKEASIPLKTSTYILTFMMPYKKKDGSEQYCEVAQSGVNPEEFGIKYAIPTYFLIDIKFQ